MNDYDAIVVGAGLLGCSAALHLLQRGVGRVAVIDVVGPGLATSGAGAGFVGAWAAGYTAPGTCAADELALEMYGIEFYRQLGGQRDLGLRTNGSLFLAATQAGYEQHVHPILRHPLAPPGTRDVSPQEVAALSGGAIDPASVYRGALHPVGIQIDTTPTVEAMATVLGELGADVRTGEHVTGLLREDGTIVGVGLPSGPVRAASTVLATGAWVNDLLGQVGVHLPIAREVASRVLSPAGGIPPMPTVMVPEWHWLWVREHDGGLTWGNVAGYAAADTLGPPVGTGQRPRYPRLIEDMVADAAPDLNRLFPGADVSVAQWRQGVVSHTPDGRFYCGSVSGWSGLYAVAGCNEGGVTHGPGLGRVLADLIVDGATDWVDASRYRLDRFAGSSNETPTRRHRRDTR